jgi:hypothetical protein
VGRLTRSRRPRPALSEDNRPLLSFPIADALGTASPEWSAPATRLEGELLNPTIKRNRSRHWESADHNNFRLGCEGSAFGSHLDQ